MNEIVLTPTQIADIRSKAKDARKQFGIVDDETPIANDMFKLLERRNIILCEYPFEASEGSHTDATLTRFETSGDPIVFIGLNTSLCYDDQIFALAHELYHYITHTGKSYTEEDEEDPIVEKKADRFAAELLLPGSVLENRVINEFGLKMIDGSRVLRTLRFIARLQSECWMPYRAIVNRLFEEDYIKDDFYNFLYQFNDRDENSTYCRIFNALDHEAYAMLNRRTRKKGVSNVAMEVILLNYEDGQLSDDEFVEILSIFGKTPDDFGYSLIDSDDQADLDELSVFFEGGE